MAIAIADDESEHFDAIIIYACPKIDGCIRHYYSFGTTMESFEIAINRFSNNDILYINYDLNKRQESIIKRNRFISSPAERKLPCFSSE